MLNNEFIKLASELQEIDSKEVVKVAGIIRRMRNWFKSFLDSEYGSQVADIRAEAKDIAAIIAEMSKSLKQLDSSIKDLDVGSYHTNLSQVHSLIPTLVQNLTQLHDKTQKADDSLPEQVKKINVHDEPDERPAEPPKPEAGPASWQIYDEPKSVSEIGVFTGVNIKAQPLASAARAIKNVLRNESWTNKDITALLAGDHRNVLFSQFKQAILGGSIKAVRPASPGKEQRRDRPETDFHYLIEMDPFVIPGTDIVLSGDVIVHDHSVDETRTLNLVRIENNEFAYKKVDPVAAPQRQEPINLDEEDLEGAEAEAEAMQAQYDEADDGEIEVPLFTHASVNARQKELNKIAGDQGATQLPKRFNKVGAVSFAQATREAYKELFGTDPTAQTLGLIWAQAAMESGQNFNLMNNNVGYVKATDKWLGPGKFYTIIENAKENTSTGEATVHRGAKFRAFRTPKEGIKSYLQILKSNWPESLQWKAAGLAVCDAAYLSENKYYTASMTKYARGMDNLFDIFMSKVATQLSPPLKNEPAKPPGKCPVFRTTRAEVGQELKSGKRNDPLAWPTKSLKHAWKGSLDVNPEARGTQPAQMKQINPDISREFMSAMRVLVADNSLTNVVRRSLEKKVLPTTKVLVNISSNNTIIKGEEINNTPALAEFARILSCALREEIEAKTAVHSDGNGFEIVCEVVGTPLAAGGAVQEISDSIAEVFVSSLNGTLNKFGRDMTVSNIKTSAHLGRDSSMPLLEMDEAMKHYRSFSFAVVN